MSDTTVIIILGIATIAGVILNFISEQKIKKLEIENAILKERLNKSGN